MHIKNLDFYEQIEDARNQKKGGSGIIHGSEPLDEIDTLFPNKNNLGK
jgi:hypothetical protein